MQNCTLTELHWMFTIIPTQNARKCVACNWPLLARERDYFRLICRTERDRRRRHIHTVSFSTRSHYWTEKAVHFQGEKLLHPYTRKTHKFIYQNEHSLSVVFLSRYTHIAFRRSFVIKCVFRNIQKKKKFLNRTHQNIYIKYTNENPEKCNQKKDERKKKLFNERWFQINARAIYPLSPTHNIWLNETETSS